MASAGGVTPYWMVKSSEDEARCSLSRGNGQSAAKPFSFVFLKEEGRFTDCKGGGSHTQKRELQRQSIPVRKDKFSMEEICERKCSLLRAWKKERKYNTQFLSWFLLQKKFRR
jgi:hypothetical protein